MGIKNFFSGLFKKDDKEENQELDIKEIQNETQENSQKEDTIFKKISEDLGEDFEELKEELGEEFESFKKELEEKTNEIKQKSQEVSKNIEEKTDSLKKEPEEEITEKKDDVSKAIQETKEDIKEKIENIIQKEEQESTKEEQPQEEEKKPLNLFQRLKDGLKKTGDNLSKKLDEVFTANVKIDDDLYEELEEILITSDISFNTTMNIIDKLKNNIETKKIKDVSLVKDELKIVLKDMLSDNDNTLNIYDKESVILIVGVNGAGKTTTIGKLSTKFKSQNKKVLLAAADTFRAAAAEQLEVWATRAKVDIVRKDEGTDPSSVVYDAIQKAKKENIDILICDTAGRLHNKKNLMMELEKIMRVIKKEYDKANLEIILVLDGATGQNALSQTKAFFEILPITGIIMTKLDGTAKGGVILSIKDELNIPIKYIGVGEKIEDLQEFNPNDFVDSIII